MDEFRRWRTRRSIGRSVQYLVLKTKLLREAGRLFLDGGFRIFLERGVQSLGVWGWHRSWGSVGGVHMQRALALR